MFSAARWSLTLYFAGAFSAILILLGAAVLFTTRASLYDGVNDDLQDRTERLQRILRERAGGPIDAPFIRRTNLIEFQTDAEALAATGYQAALTTPEVFLRTVNYEYAGLPQYPDLTESVSDEPATANVTTPDGEDLRFRVEPVRGGGFIVVARSIEPEQQALEQLFVVLAGGGVVGLVLAGAGGFFLAGRALRPIQGAMDAQRTFVADASHELRTPLSLIRANAEIMKREAKQGGGAESLDDIIKETDHLSYLVGQMLTLARADVRGTAFESEDVDISELAGGIVREVGVLARERQIALNIQNEPGIHVQGDRQRLRELLLILLDNALKYTAEGGTVNVGLERVNSDVRLSVADNGDGIPAADLPHVFHRFYRVDKARSREVGGTGLGLAIARWIAEAHAGSIRLDSTVGEGTTATVDLPARS